MKTSLALELVCKCCHVDFKSNALIYSRIPFTPVLLRDASNDEKARARLKGSRNSSNHIRTHQLHHKSKSTSGWTPPAHLIKHIITNDHRDYWPPTPPLKSAVYTRHISICLLSDETPVPVPPENLQTPRHQIRTFPQFCCMCGVCANAGCTNVLNGWRGKQKRLETNGSEVKRKCFRLTAT